MRKIDMYITNKQYGCLKAESVKRSVTFSEILRKIIDIYYEKKQNG